MASTTTNSLYVNIKELPSINDINNGDFLIVETPDGTSIIDYQDFFITLQNTTFESTIDNLQTDTQTISADLIDLENKLSPVYVSNTSNKTLDQTNNNQVFLSTNTATIVGSTLVDNKVTYTIPSGLPANFYFKVLRAGSGSVDILPGVGVSINGSTAGVRLSAYSASEVFWTGTDTYLVDGKFTVI
jgi:hypothetical protein